MLNDFPLLSDYFFKLLLIDQLSEINIRFNVRSFFVVDRHSKIYKIKHNGRILVKRQEIICTNILGTLYVFLIGKMHIQCESVITDFPCYRGY
jgi:hypothetical protein